MGDGRWVRGNLTRYSWPQCGFCGRAQSHDCKPATCPLCETTLCFGAGHECGVCHYGLIPGWSKMGREVCGYAGCGQPSIAKAPRVGQACAGHVDRAKVRLGARSYTLREYAALRVAERDKPSGQTARWVRWHLVGA